MTTNASYSPLWRVESPVRRLRVSSILAWSGSALAAFAGFSGAVAQAWTLPLVAFCAGMGVAFTCHSVAVARRRSKARTSVAASDLAPRSSTCEHLAGFGIWQEIDRNRDLLHLLQEKTRPQTSAARPTAISRCGFGVEDGGGQGDRE